MILSIVTSVFLVTIVSGISNNDSTDDWHFDDYEVNFEDSTQQNAILICCAWGEELADGELIQLETTINSITQRIVNQKD